MSTDAQLKKKGFSPGKIAYWHKKLPGAGLHQILKARSKQVYNHNPDAIVQGGELTPLQLKRDVNAGVKAKYGQAEAGLKNVQSQIPAWYQAYRDQLDATKAQAAQNYAGLAGQITTEGNNAVNGVGNQTAANLKKLQDDAVARGSTGDPNLAAIAKTSLGGQNANVAAAASRASQTGQATQDYLGTLSANSHLQEGQMGANVAARLAAMMQEAGGYGVTLRQNEVKQAQNFALGKGALNIQGQNAATNAKNASTALFGAKSLAGNRRGTLRLNKDKLSETQNYHDALVKIKNRAANLNDSKNALANTEFAAKYGITPGAFNKLTDAQKLAYLKKNKITIGSKGGLGSQKGGPSAGQLSKSRDLVGQIYNAMHDFDRLSGTPFGSGPYAGKKPTPQQLDSLMLDGKKYSPILYQAAKDIRANKGRLSPQTYQALIHSGVLPAQLKRWKPVYGPQAPASVLK